jgi:hypothetical protein
LFDGNFARGTAGRKQARNRLVERIPTGNKKGEKGVIQIQEVEKKMKMDLKRV